MRSKIIFYLILFLAVFLRLWNISNTPPSLNWDEVSHGYNAYSIIKTGRDEWGEKFPSIFRAYGDYKLPVYIYTTIPFVAFFGLNEFSVRFPSVLAGVGTVIFSYLLSKKLFGEKVSLLTMFLVAVEPWSLFLSRGAFEANLALFLFIAGIYFFVTKRFLPAAIFLGLTVWTYNSYRIFTPLMIAVLVPIYYRKSLKLLTPSFLVLTFFLAPMFYQLFNPVGLARYGKVSIVNEGVVSEIIEKRQASKLPEALTRLIYNRPVYFVREFVGNYFKHFDPNLLFFKGGSHYQFSIPGKGLIYLVNLPFFLLGLYFLARQKTKESLITLSWLLLAPIASSLTSEAPHVLRSITFLPVPMIISAYGVGEFLTRFRSRFTILIYIIVVLASLGIYLRNYLTDYRINYSWAWQNGYKEAVFYARANYDKYDKIIVTKKYGEPHEFFLFFMSWDPAKYQNDGSAIRFYQSGWWWVDRFDKFYFVNDWQVREMRLESGDRVDCETTKCLLITSPDNYPAGWSKIGKVDFLNGQPAFEIYENY